ncbi:MAG: cryptochrome/photolyase family protein [Pseudomonadota bacterium]
MTTALLIFPHQLFDAHPGFEHKPDKILLFEDPLFFGDPQYPARLHKQKLWLHRATMTRFAARLEQRGMLVEHVHYVHAKAAVTDLVQKLGKDGVGTILVSDPVDYTASKRLQKASEAHDVALQILDTPGFLNTTRDNQRWAGGRKRWFMAEYYKHQRRRLNVLMDGDEPVGGKWSFDEDNRKKVPKKLLSELPELPSINRDAIDTQARDEINAEFPEGLGSIDSLIFPTSHDDAADWLDTFLKERFELFGDYEDALVEGESWLWHGVLTPMLNVGLLTPLQVLDATLKHADKHDVPLNSLEGFVRQIIGWREFMRATYEELGVKMRTTNHWQHKRKIPESFYKGTTGIVPIDDVISRALKTGYCHHIERLMVLGGFMFLCEFDPDEVYRWFMEMFVDSYDWVMVPNAYAMSQHADGGLITTKPYFSGSNYIKKMSNYQAGDWADTWDGLYWRFIWKHHDRLAKNPRWAMMCRTVSKMDETKRDAHLKNAETYLASLDL